MLQRGLWKKLIFIVIIFVFVVGCDQKSEQIQPVPSMESRNPETLVTIQPFTNSFVSPVVQVQSIIPDNFTDSRPAIRGKLISSMTQIPIAETAVYLTKGAGENNDLLPLVLVGPLDDDILGFTDKQGYFLFSNVPPGIYYLIIWSPINWVPLSNATTNPDDPIQIVLKENQYLNLGEIVVNWP